jgi:hypothetical protein
VEAIKVRLRLGSVEIDYEGPEGFLKENVPALLTEISHLACATPVQVTGGRSPVMAEISRSDTGLLDFSTNTIASLIEAKTGPDLAMAAAAHLSLAKGQDRFTRSDLLGEMQGAATFYNQSYSGNLSKILNGLTKRKRLNLVGNNTFALTRSERESFTAKLSSES